MIDCQAHLDGMLELAEARWAPAGAASLARLAAPGRVATARVLGLGHDPRDVTARGRAEPGQLPFRHSLYGEMNP